MIDRLADLTSVRDCEALDAALVGIIGDLIEPHGAAIVRPDDDDESGWTTAARWSGPDTPGIDGSKAARDEAFAGGGASTARGPAGLVLSCYPLTTGLGTAGVLELVSRGPLGTARGRLLDGILRLYRNHRDLLDDCERDTLTGLLNRKTFDRSFFGIVQSAGDAAAGFGASVDHDERRRADARGDAWLAMIDIDHFKAVNDTHGHLIGDEVLLLVARLMRRTLRANDRLYRFGGEEFAIIARCDGTANATACFDRLRRSCEAFAFPKVERLTISIGFTRIFATDMPSSALERADRAVYHAKGTGRNRVCHDRDMASGPEADARVGEVELF